MYKLYKYCIWISIFMNNKSFEKKLPSVKNWKDFEENLIYEACSIKTKANVIIGEQETVVLNLGLLLNDMSISNKLVKQFPAVKLSNVAMATTTIYSA